MWQHEVKFSLLQLKACGQNFSNFFSPFVLLPRGKLEKVKYPFYPLRNILFLCLYRESVKSDLLATCFPGLISCHCDSFNPRSQGSRYPQRPLKTQCSVLALFLDSCFIFIFVIEPKWFSLISPQLNYTFIFYFIFLSRISCCL